MNYYITTQKRKHGVSVFDLYMILMLIFPVFTVVQNIGIINKILFAALILCQLYVTILNPVKVHTFVQYLITGSVYIYSLFVTVYPVGNINMFFYYPYTVLYMLFILDNKDRIIEWFKRSEKYVRLIIRIWCLIVFISMFLPSGYYVKEGGISYFGSFCGTIFRLGPAAIFIQILILISMKIYGNSKDFFFNIIPMYSFFMGSSRTYLIIGLCLFIIAWSWFTNNKKLFALTLIPVILLAIVFMLRTSIGEKISYTLDENLYGDFWFRITSSRSVLWEKDMTAWLNEPFVNKLLGSGIDFTVEASSTWGHNDFIELICSFGIVGVLQYIYLMFKLIKTNIINKRTPVFIIFLTVLVWIFNAFFNMHYVYFCAMLSYPLLLLIINEVYQPKTEEENI